jgi:predicted RNase H-like HicB family nuclease
VDQSQSGDSFEIVYEPEAGGGYHVLCPALKGCHSYGRTKAEARRNISEAIELWLETAAEIGIPLPERETVAVARR